MLSHTLLMSCAAEYYVKTMERIQERGSKYPRTERERIKGILKKGGLKKDKQAQMEARVNILVRHARNQLHMPRDQLLLSKCYSGAGGRPRSFGPSSTTKMLGRNMMLRLSGSRNRHLRQRHRDRRRTRMLLVCKRALLRGRRAADAAVQRGHVCQHDGRGGVPALRTWHAATRVQRDRVQCM